MVEIPVRENEEEPRRGWDSTRLRYRPDPSEGERNRGNISGSVFYCSVILMKIQIGFSRVLKRLPEIGLP